MTALPEPLHSPSAAAPAPVVPAPADLRPIVAANVRRLRVQRGLSLERLSKASGVSRAMLSQIELEHSTPTVTVLAKIARALDLPISTFLARDSDALATVLRHAESRSLVSADGATVSRSLLPPDPTRAIEFEEITLGPHASENVEPRPPGTKTTLVVHSGALTLCVGTRTASLHAGDSTTFASSHAHVFANPHAESARLFVLVQAGETPSAD